MLFGRANLRLKCPWHEFFLRKYLAYHMYMYKLEKKEKFQKS